MREIAVSRKLFMMVLFLFIIFAMSCGKPKIKTGTYVTTLKSRGEEIDVKLELTFEPTDSSGRFIVTRNTNPLNKNRTFLPDSIMLEEGEFVSFIIKPKFDKENYLTFYITNEDFLDKPDLFFKLAWNSNRLEGIWKFDDTMSETPIAFNLVK